MAQEQTLRRRERMSKRALPHGAKPSSPVSRVAGRQIETNEGFWSSVFCGLCSSTSCIFRTDKDVRGHKTLSELVAKDAKVHVEPDGRFTFKLRPVREDHCGFQ